MAFGNQGTIQGAVLGEILTFYPNGILTCPIKDGEAKNINMGMFVTINATTGEVEPYDGALASGIATYDFEQNCSLGAIDTLNKKVNVGLSGAFVAKVKAGETMVRGGGFDIDATGEITSGAKGSVIEIYDNETCAVFYGQKGVA